MSALGKGGVVSVLLLGTLVALAATVTAESLVDRAKDTVDDAVSPLAPPALPSFPSAHQLLLKLEQALSPARDQVRALQGQANQAAGGAATQAQATADGVVAEVRTVVGLVDVQALVAKATGLADDAQETANGFVGDVKGTLETNEALQPQSAPNAVSPVAPASPIAALVAVGVAALGAGAGAFLFWLAGSSGTVGAGAVASRGTDLKRLLPFASPLFTRFEKDTVLGHPRREALYALILQQPGISLQALGDATGLSRTAVLHHLRLIEQQHLIVSIRKGRSRHYYENGGRFGHDQKDAYAVLQNGRSKEVAEAIRANPGILQKGLCQQLGIQPSIAHWHVRRLVDAKLVETIHSGRTVAYFPAAALTGLQQPVPAVLPATVAPVLTV
jgi:DNA-binding transcriptional ArsR family regulator